MARVTRQHRSEPKVPAHPRLLTTDLKSWTGEHVARTGRRDALLGRVDMLRVGLDGRSLDARVRGHRPLPYQVHVELQDGDGIACRCTCAKETDLACRHAVAALEALRFPLSAVPQGRGPGRRRRSSRRAGGAGKVIQAAPDVPGFLVLGGAERMLTRDERVGAAQIEELVSRRQRARRERARVTLLDGPGPARFSVRAKQEPDGPFVVTLRGPKGVNGSCTCDDYAANELATCKHVARARAWYSRKKKPPAVERLSLWWRPRPWPERVPDPLRELRVDVPDGADRGALAGYFDDEGWLREPPAGQSGSERGRQAVESARAVAVERGWEFDLDDQALQRIDAVAADVALSASLRAIAPSGPVWQGVTSKLGFTLHPYQEAGAIFLARRGRALLADDMGLGKTIQAIVAALLLRQEAGACRALVVCPASLKHQWRQEIERACGERAVVVDGHRTDRLEAYRTWSSGFLILNYELVLRDLDAIRAAGADLVILDEAQRIKNWETKTAKAVKQLRSPHAFILTGTPLENRLLELHSLVEFLHPRALGPRWRLLPIHAANDAQGRVVAYEGLDLLRKRLDGFFLRRDREEVLDQLPERTDNTFWTGMTPLQLRPYRRHAATVAALLSQGQVLHPAEVRRLLQALTRMRVLCNAYAQYAWEDHEPRLRDPEPPSVSEIKSLGSPKLEEFSRVLEDLLDESDEKIVVFSQWERMLRLTRFAIREVMDCRDLRSEVFHGGLTGRARSELLDEFRLDPDFRVLFSTDAGGLGLNLQHASVVVHLEVPWNPAVLEQRIGRVHRLGQRRSVRVLHFVSRKVIEERVRQVVESKRALFDGLLVDEADRIVFDEDGRTSMIRKLCELIDETDRASF